jgi:hypothetical protein
MYYFLNRLAPHFFSGRNQGRLAITCPFCVD